MMARKYWPNEDPIGRRMKYGNLSGRSPWMTIVGVVRDTRRTGYDSPVRPETYLPHAQSPSGSMLVVVRTTGDPQSAAPVLRSVVKALDPGIALQTVQPVDLMLVEMAAERRLSTMLLSIFGVVAAVLGAGGFDPTVVVGGRIQGLGANARLGQGEFLVAEADESDGSFLTLSPTIAVVTTVDAGAVAGVPASRSEVADR